MKILLLYSRTHFDPDRDEADNRYRRHSAAVLARAWHTALGRFGDVEYLDQAEYQQAAGRAYDLFVGIGHNFHRVLRAANVKRSLFFAVNMHPAWASRRLIGFALRERLPLRSGARGDPTLRADIARGIAMADAVAFIGNHVTSRSFTRSGVPHAKLRMLNYGLPHADPEFVKRHPGGTTRFLYLATEVGLRKGFDVLSGMFSSPRVAALDLELHIVGLVENPIYAGKVAQLKRVLGDRCVIHGWLDSSGPDYAQILDRCDALVFPTLEEGQAGTVLDCISRGIIPILSDRAGFDFSPLGFLEAKVRSSRNRDLLAMAADLGVDEMNRLSGQTMEYYRDFHHGFEQAIDQTVADMLQGHTRPLLSVILPIHDKAGTIVPLLTRLDRAMNAHGHAELIAIFDGCTDGTEEKFRRFYAGRHAYPVSTFSTPDIFEVKTNNLGLQAARGKYCAIVQDDNFLLDEGVLAEATTFLERNPRAAILGCLAGVNFYPLGHRGLQGPGQVVASDDEVYWRQDERADPTLREKVFRVDACMRGPLLFRKDYLERHGYLDEAYAPLYNDDMDICFRAARDGFAVYAMLAHVRNKSLTMARPASDSKRSLYEQAFKRNAALLYRRWTPSVEKDYLWVWRNMRRSSPRSVLSELLLEARLRLAKCLPASP